jgi:hypothetical protein
LSASVGTPRRIESLAKQFELGRQYVMALGVAVAAGGSADARPKSRTSGGKICRRNGENLLEDAWYRTIGPGSRAANRVQPA